MEAVDPDDAVDIVIVGAGLAGLAAAHQLKGAGLRVRVLEAAPQVGGRMRTERVDGYRLDRGPGLFSMGEDTEGFERLPALDPLALRPFAPGAVLHADGRTHKLTSPANRRQPEPREGRPGRESAGRSRTGRATRTGIARFDRHTRGTRGALTAARALTGARSRADMSEALDLARLRAALARFAAQPAEGLLARPELPAAQALSARGLPSRTVDTLVQPLLTALLSDPGLTTSSRVADLTLRGFARGGLCVPAGGQAAVPELLAAALPPGTLLTGVRVTSVSTHAVTTERHGTFGCEAVLVATGARSAAGLLPGLRVPGFHPVTVLHHATDESPPHGPSFVVSAEAEGAGPVSHTWVTSAVDPSRAEPGRTLVTSVVLGEQAAEPPALLDKAARQQLTGVYGACADRWELLAAYHDPDAVPAMPAPHDPRRPVRVLSGLYVCGDHRDTSSPRGALSSAERATREILRDFGRPTVREDTRATAAA
ncbi:NAD(P)/FAD-dependent oxidoreductase [Streptomyces iconiensis]|uniref:NAD(P)/FAD-dependent oxidoreductase n=1 Tax=Streptomyces iconiensis TaxID=1384038 RepID=A0ABT7A542_9ACTN|nr:NAD(P)/FAD-dependent oxidoreductase [Streptomyces iconiensis]MDJ1136463.1 NAD(P)/FAD-dependent oxidoreductase [Streptomyces iconiensis]